MRLHAKMPDFAFHRGAHLLVSRFLPVVNRTRRVNNSGIGNHALMQQNSFGLQVITHQGKHLLRQVVLFQ